MIGLVIVLLILSSLLIVGFFGSVLMPSSRSSWLRLPAKLVMLRSQELGEKGRPVSL